MRGSDGKRKCGRKWAGIQWRAKGAEYKRTVSIKTRIP